jgi:hypothetical protein
VDVARQPAEPWQLRQQKHRGPDRRDEESCHEEEASDVVHGARMRPPRGAVQVPTARKLDGRRLRWLFFPTMPAALARSSVTLAVLATLALVATTARAEEMPPKEAPPYSAVYKTTSKSRVMATDEWTFQSEDTVTIAVLNKQSRWDYKSDGRTILNDLVGRTATSFGGTMAPNTATRVRTTYTPIGWEFGMSVIATATPAKPEILGTATIAGRECTRIRYVSTQFGKPEFCVTKTGITLRFANASSTAEAVYEAQSVDETAPPANRFTVPAGYKVEERAPGIRKDLKL